MRIKPKHINFICPKKGSNKAGAFDIYMPEDGFAHEHTARRIGLGFAAEVPDGYVALILPRSGVGSSHGVELNNTCGVIDSDYRGEWIATLRTKAGHYHWNAGDRVLQFLIVPVADVTLEVVDELTETERGTGGLGSSGK